jgi:hypothetical protein
MVVTCCLAVVCHEQEPASQRQPDEDTAAEKLVVMCHFAGWSEFTKLAGKC